LRIGAARGAATEAGSGAAKATGAGAAKGAARVLRTGAGATGTWAITGAAAMPLKVLATTWLLAAVTTGAGAATTGAGKAASGAWSSPGLPATQAIRAQMTTACKKRNKLMKPIDYAAKESETNVFEHDGLWFFDLELSLDVFKAES